MDALIESFWRGVGWTFGMGMGFTLWITVLFLIAPGKKKPPVAPKPPTPPKPPEQPGGTDAI
jgi:hypothetical protein